MEVCSKLPQTHLPTLAVSGVSMVFLIAAKEINSAISARLPVPIPVELITVSYYDTLSAVSPSCRSVSLFLMFLYKNVFFLFLPWLVKDTFELQIFDIGYIRFG